LATFRDDFARYSRRHDPRLLRAALDGVVVMLGRKLLMARIGAGPGRYVVREVLDRLVLARLIQLSI
jgi:hypothetical protein